MKWVRRQSLQHWVFLGSIFDFQLDNPTSLAACFNTGR
jgi:hypothetical protein